MLGCFENLIGISGDCEPVVPTSGKYLNTLHGVKLGNVAAAVTENVSYKDLLSDLIAEATYEVENEFRTIIQPHLKFNSILEDGNIGFYKENQVAEALSAGNFRGVRVKINSRPFLAFNLNSVTLKLDAALEVTVRVFDLMSGATLDTFIINTVAGVPTIKYVNKKYINYGQNLRLAVVYDTGVAGTYTTSASPYTGGNCSGCAGKYANKYIGFDGVSFLKTASAIDPNITTITGTAGISLNYSLVCDPGYTLCNVAQLLADPIRYKTAEKIFLEMMSPSPRLNTIVTVQAKEVEFFQQYYGGKYLETISPILKSWQPPEDECFYCYKKLVKRVLIP